MAKVGNRILVVEDERNALCAIAELLRDDDYTVETAANGVEALAKLELFDPDLVLTDLEMPGLHGIGLLRELRARGSKAVIVVMTAYSVAQAATALFTFGATAFLPKPIDVNELRATLERELATGKA